MEDRGVGKHLSEGLHITCVERLVASTDYLLIGMSHGPHLLKSRWQRYPLPRWQSRQSDLLAVEQIPHMAGGRPVSLADLMHIDSGHRETAMPHALADRRSGCNRVPGSGVGAWVQQG